MQIVSALVSGIELASNGHAEVYRYGSRLRAMYYLDFEGFLGVGSFPGVDVSLDSNGGAVVYVNEPVLIRVFGFNGVLVQDFVQMPSSGSIEVISPSFSGASYEDGTSGTNEPTTLKAVTDLWGTKTDGGKDWGVSYRGDTKTIIESIDAWGGIFVNVKDPTYGATGDGTTDDLTAIQAAIGAASAAGVSGGVVVFPVGTYRVTAQIDVSVNVSLLGVSSTGSIITIDHATANLLVFADGYDSSETIAHKPVFVKGLRLTAAQSSAGRMITGTGLRVSVVDCVLGDGGNSNGDNVILLSSNPSSGGSFYSCHFITEASSQSIVGTSKQLNVSNCILEASGSLRSGALLDCGTATLVRTWGNYFDNRVVSTGPYNCVRLVACVGDSNAGNVFSDTNTAVAYAWAPVTIPTANEEVFSEDGSQFGTGVVPYLMVSTSQSVHLGTREKTLEIDSPAATVTIDSDQFGIAKVTNTALANMTINMIPAGSFAYRNAEHYLIIWNNQAGILAVAFNVAQASINTPVNIAANSVRIWHSKSFENNSIELWFQSGTPPESPEA